MPAMPASPRDVTAFIEEQSSPLQRQPQPQPQPQQGRRKMYGKCSLGKLLSTAAICLALLLVIAAIYMHVIQKPHLGRLRVKPSAPDESEVEAGAGATSPHQLVTEPAVAALSTRPPLSAECLECIAATATANKPAMCRTSPCSVYRISQPYWQDAMRQGAYMGVEDYESCVSNPDCAAATVHSFIRSYARDCDGDGLIQCRDHIMLHQLGPTGCLVKPLPALSQTRMDDCLRAKELE